jgi:hypothetical protein
MVDTGIILIPMSGFDSIPSDLGTFMVCMYGCVVLGKRGVLQPRRSFPVFLGRGVCPLQVWRENIIC